MNQEKQNPAQELEKNEQGMNEAGNTGTAEAAEAGKKENTADASNTPEAAGQTGNAGSEAKAGAEDSPETGGEASEAAQETYTFTREQVEKMELAAKQLETTKDQYVRLTAEYDNYRKRTAREKENLWQDAKADTIKAFLPVYDNLERAVNQAGSEDSPHKKGLEMIYQQVRDVLKNLGVCEIAAYHQPFDPERHNAVQHIEDEKLEENTVAQVFQSGFTLGEKVIRHAMVVVAN